MRKSILVYNKADVDLLYFLPVLTVNPPRHMHRNPITLTFGWIVVTLPFKTCRTLGLVMLTS
jgi:hypothetical protein